MPAHRRRLGRHLTILLVYTALSLALTYPLITQFASHVPGDGIDDPALAWNLWWVKFSLVDQHANPFPSGWMFYPIGINLAFYTLTVLNGLLSVPLQTALGLVAASNLVLLSSFVLGAYGTYLLVLDVLGGDESRGGSQREPVQQASLILHLSAFLAGLLVAFSSSKMFYVSLGQFNIASSQWIPFAVLYVLRSGRPEARLREPLMAALFLALQAYAELTYATFLAIFIALYAAYRLGQMALAAFRSGRQRQAGRDRAAWAAIPAVRQSTALLRNLAVMALVCGLALLPMLANMLPDMRAEGDFLVEGGGFADIFSADLAGYALPTQLHPLAGSLVRQAASDSQIRPDGSQWQVNKGQHLTLGYAGLGLVLLGVWAGRRRPDTGFWALAALLFFLLTLGPSVRIAGHDTGIPGLFRLVQGLPFLKGNRYASRYSVMLLVSVAPLLAMGSRWILARLAGRWKGTRGPATVSRRLVASTALLAGLLLFENLSAPLPTSDMRVPAIYERLAAQPEGGALLDLPVGWRNGFSVFGKQDTIIMFEQWWQTAHERPLLGGNTSRNPEHKFRYFLEAPLIGPLTVLANADEAHPHIRSLMADGLAALSDGDPELGGNGLLLQAAAESAGTLAALDITHLVIHRDHVPPEFTTFIETYLPVTRLEEDGQDVLYEVALPAPSETVTIRPGQDPLSRGEGWSGTAQVPGDQTGQEPGLWAQRETTRLVLPPLQPGSRQVTVRARAAGPGQQLSLAANGYRTEPQPLPESWADLTYVLPTGVLTPGVNEVTLQFASTYPVDDVRAREGLGPAGLLVESAGLEAGDYGHIWLNGRDISPNQRGYNVALIDAETWQPAAVAAFDTHADPGASAALVAFLEGREDGSIVVLAVKDTASDRLSAEAAAALGELGVTDLRGRFRWSQAAIVMPDGQVLERADGLQAVSTGAGPGWREPQVAALVDWVQVEPQGS